jgi:hypothetical protein
MTVSLKNNLQQVFLNIQKLIAVNPKNNLSMRRRGKKAYNFGKQNIPCEKGRT